MGFDTILPWDKFDAAMEKIHADTGVFESPEQKDAVIVAITTAIARTKDRAEKLSLINSVASAFSGTFTLDTLRSALPLLAGVI